MPSYTYSATSQTGEKITGTEVVENERALAKLLHDKGYVVTHAELQEKKEKARGSFLSRFQKVSLSEKLVFTRNLGVMVGAGIPLPRALDTLGKQTKSKKFQAAILSVREKVLKGQALSEALQDHTDVFSDLFINMIQAGEQAGTLEEVLDQLTLQMERDYEIRSRIRGALLYPAVIVSAMLVIATFMLGFVVPRLAEVFEDLNVDLPLTTRAVVALGTFMSERWYVVLVVFIVLIGVAYQAVRTKSGKRIVDAGFLRMPVIGGIVRKTNAALTTRTLSSLLAAGVPIVNSLTITSRVLGNSYFKEALETSSKEVQKGTKLSDVLTRYDTLYPVMVIQMVAVGEETGETTDILKKLADFFEEEVTNITKNLTSIIEPILMLVIGVAVGFFAISMFQPMYSMLGSLQ